MDIHQWLLTQTDIDLSGLAKRMWPGNPKGAASYMSRKLHGKDGRKWTEKDSELAREHLHKLGIELTKL